MVDNSGNPTLPSLRRQWHETHSEPALLRLVDACRRRGLLDEAVAVLREGVRRKPRRLAPRVALGRCLLEAGELAAAAEMLGGVVDQDPTQMVANKLLVQVHLAREDGDQAALRLDLYGLLNPGDPELGELEVQVKAACRRERVLAGAAPSPRAIPPAVPVAEAAAPAPDRLWTPRAEQALFPGGDQADSSSYWSTVAAGPFGGAIRQRVEPRRLELRRLEPRADRGPSPVSSSGEPTATLGRLYLQQGHPQEAARIFRQVLRRDPCHAGAQEGMSAVATLAPPQLRAADLLAIAEPGEGPTSSGGSERRRAMLNSYLEAVLGGS